jgi:hypothetical protein
MKRLSNAGIKKGSIAQDGHDKGQPKTIIVHEPSCKMLMSLRLWTNLDRLSLCQSIGVEALTPLPAWSQPCMVPNEKAEMDAE